MFANYFTSAIRTLKRDKFHAALNISGLAVSLAAALLIALYIQHELSYEDFFTQPDRVYRIDTHYENAGQPPIDFGASPGPTKDALEADFPGQMTVTSLLTGNRVISTGDKLFRYLVIFGDNNLFKVLDLPVLAGDAVKALATPGTVILSQKMATRLFGTENAIGKSVRIGPKDEFRVGAVLKDLPDNTHLHDTFDILTSIDAPAANNDRPWYKHWSNASFYTYVRLADNVRAADIEAQLGPMVERRTTPEERAVTLIRLRMRPLPDIHLYAGDDGFTTDRNVVTMYALGGVAAFLILIACFNYINLTTARALLRTKEVGMRKILGGSTPQLVSQFMAETLSVTLLAFLLAFALAAVCLPVFATLIDRELSLSELFSPSFLGIAVLLLAFVSLAAGTYPAFVLASSKPVTLFQNQKTSTGGRNFFRSAMVGVQFTLTVGLVIAASVVFTQVNYLKTLDLGFKKDGLLVINALPTGEDKARGAAYRQALLQSPYITAVTGTNSRPQANYENNDVLTLSGSETYKDQALQSVYVDPAFFDVYGLTAIAGRVLSDDFGDDEAGTGGGDKVGHGGIVISQSAVPYFGFASAKDAIGKHLIRNIDGDRGDYTIIGVVPEIQYRLGRAPTKPMVYHYNSDYNYLATARVAPGGTEAAIDFARKTWEQMFPSQPFQYFFLDDLIARAGADDNRQSQLFTFFTGLAIVVACLGLFGLASFVAARRTQEIAIRKVMGASTSRITGLLLWDFAKPVLLANIVAWPIAWLLMRQWLNGFPYRVDLSPAFFVGASAVALGIALLTVMARTLKAARIRPAAALKYE